MSLGQAFLIPGLGGGPFASWSYKKTWTPPALGGTQRVLVRLADDADIKASANRDGSDIRFTASGSTTVLDYELIGAEQFVQMSNNWTWYNWPQAISDGTYAYIAFLTADGYIGVSQYTQSTATYTHTLLQSGPFVKDDHCTPSLYKLGNNKVFVGYSKHGSEQYFRYKISTNANDTTAWDAEQTIDAGVGEAVTYSQLHTLGSNLWIGYRTNSSGIWSYSLLSATDASGSPTKQDFWDGTTGGGQSYCLSSSRGTTGRLDFATTDKDGDNNNRRLYHFYTDGTDWYDTAGNTLSSGTASLPLTRGDLEGATDSYVFDATSDGDTIMLADVIYGTDGYPHILVVKYVSDVTTNHDLHVFSYNGSSWSDTKITDLGGTINASVNYHSGARFGADETEVLAPVEVSGVYEIQRWTNSGGWSKTEDITTGSTHDNYRPEVVVGTAVDDFEFVWLGFGGLYGTHSTYTSIDACQAYPGRRTWDYAWVVTDGALDIYYGNANAVDAQNASGVWSGDSSIVLHPWQRGDRIDQLHSSIGQTFSLHYTAVLSHWLDRNGIFPAIQTDFLTTTTVPYWKSSAWAIENSSSIFVECWLKYSDTGTGYKAILSNWDSGQTVAKYMARVNASNNLVRVNVFTATDNSESHTSTDTVSEGAWHQLVFGFDGSVPEGLTRVDKVGEETSSLTGTQLDADSNNTELWCMNNPDSSVQDVVGSLMYLRAIIDRVPSETETNLHYDMVNDTGWATFGSEGPA